MAHDEGTEPKRPLLWWHVPERPGVGRSMLRTVLVWFVALFALVVIVGAVVAFA